MHLTAVFWWIEERIETHSTVPCGQPYNASIAWLVGHCRKSETGEGKTRDAHEYRFCYCRTRKTKENGPTNAGTKYIRNSFGSTNVRCARRHSFRIKCIYKMQTIQNMLFNLHDSLKLCTTAAKYIYVSGFWLLAFGLSIRSRCILCLPRRTAATHFRLSIYIYISCIYSPMNVICVPLDSFRLCQRTLHWLSCTVFFFSISFSFKIGPEPIQFFGM